MSEAGKRRICCQTVSPMLVAVLCFAVAAGGLVVQVARRWPTAAATNAPHDEANWNAAIVGFEKDAARSLSPLVTSFQQLTTLISESLEKRPSPAVAGMVESWAFQFATARDLVGRLHPPASPHGGAAQELAREGAVLYTESTAALLASLGMTDEAARLEAVKSADRFRRLGDRLFDASRRLLSADGPGEVAIALRQEVSDGLPGFEDRNSGSTVKVGAWLERQRRILGDVTETLDLAVPAIGGANVDAGRIVPPLDRAVEGLGAPLPVDSVHREAAQVLRLSILVGAESLRTLAWKAMPEGRGSSAWLVDEQPRRVWAAGERIWNAAVGVLVDSKARLACLSRESAHVSPEVANRGGVFNGNPPPLAPGQDPGAGLPGGLAPLSLEVTP